MTLPDTEQETRAKWDLLLADNEFRLEQIRRIKQEMHLAPWQLTIAGFSAGAAWVAVAFAIAKLL